MIPMPSPIGSLIAANLAMISWKFTGDEVSLPFPFVGSSFMIGTVD